MKLEGVKVLDLSMYLPGPHLTMMMADHGATVVRIEPPSGEPTRSIGKYQGDTTVWFRNTHRNKQSVVLDLKKAEGVEAFMRLAADADVIVEAFRPGVVDRLGIGPRAVRERYPRVVYCSIAAFGQTGPMAARVAHDLSIEAESGVVSLNHGADGAPALPCVPAADMAGSLMAMSGILMALLRREQSGRGDTIDISMQDSLVSWMVNIVSPVFAEGRELDPTTERSLGGNAFYNLYRCADGRSLTLGGSEIKFAANLLSALGRPDLIELCKLPPGRGQDPVREFLAATFAHARPCTLGRFSRQARRLLGAGERRARGDAERTPRRASDEDRVRRRPDAPRHSDQVRRGAGCRATGRAAARRAHRKRARRRRCRRRGDRAPARRRRARLSRCFRGRRARAATGSFAPRAANRSSRRRSRADRRGPSACRGQASAERRTAGVAAPENFIGMPGIGTVVPSGSGTSTTMSRARICGSESACAKSLTGPHGMRASRSLSSQ